MRCRVLFCVASIAVAGCAQRLDLGRAGDAASSDTSTIDTSLPEGGVPDGASLDGSIVEGGLDDAGREDCPPPVLLASMSSSLSTGKGKILRYSLRTQSRCDDLALDMQGVYASYSRGEQMIVAAGGVIRRVHPETGATRWQHDYIDDYPNAREPTIFEVDFPEGQRSIAAVLFDPLMADQLEVFYFFDPETGAVREEWNSFDIFPSNVTGFAPHPNGGPWLLGSRYGIFGLAEFELKTVGRAQSPYLVEQDVPSERFRSYQVGGDTVVLWIDSEGFRYSRVGDLQDVSPLGPAACGNLECTIRDVIPDPVDPDRYYVACWGTDLVVIDVQRGQCQVAIAGADDPMFVIQALSFEP